VTRAERNGQGTVIGRFPQAGLEGREKMVEIPGGVISDIRHIGPRENLLRRRPFQKGKRAECGAGRNFGVPVWKEKRNGLEKTHGRLNGRATTGKGEDVPYWLPARTKRNEKHGKE